MSNSSLYQNFSTIGYVKELFIEELAIKYVLHYTRTVLESNCSFLVILVLVNCLLFFSRDLIFDIQAGRRNPLFRNWIVLASQIFVGVGFRSLSKSITLFPTSRLESFGYNLLSCVCFPMATAFGYGMEDLKNTTLGNDLFFAGIFLNICYFLPEVDEDIVNFCYVFGSQLHTVGSAIKIFSMKKVLRESSRKNEKKRTK